ncbi:MAG: ABC transporter ATP-binding protein [Janthinobacterium lividum]
MNKLLPKSSTRLFLFFLKFQKKKITAFIILCIMTGIIPSVDSILLQKITDTIEQSSSGRKLDFLSSMFSWALSYGLWWESLNILWRIYDYIYLKFMPVIKGKIIEEIYDYTQQHQHKFFQHNPVGNITNRIIEASRSFEMIFSILTERIITKLSIIIFASITMFNVHRNFATIFLIWVTAFISISLMFSKRINNYSTEYAGYKSLVAGKIVDAISNITSIRIFMSHRFEKRYLRDQLSFAVKSDQNMQWFMFKLRYVLSASCSIMIFTMIYYISVLRSQSLITVGDCVLIITLCLAVTDEIWDLNQEIGDMFEEVGTFKQSMSLIEPHNITDTEYAEDLIVSTGRIEFRNVTFNYRNDNNLFKNKSVIISGGQRVGLVGYSGSGKTTFVNLISRFYDIEEGQILIDEQDIKQVTQNSLRNNISVIPQEPILFNRTIIENIRYGSKKASDEEIINVAKQAHIHDFIMTLPEKYNTICGERGNNLSGGERQRIVIARAILKNSQILILDEATSSLDSNTENLIQDSLNNLMQDKTVIIVAHRLSTLLNMDRILVFNKGKIIEDGNHEELMKASELYKKLWKSQIKGLIPQSP